MRLYLQFGHGMMAHAVELVKEWGSGGVILSPRDLDDGQLKAIGPKVTKVGGDVLVDPQCFVRDADHHRLTGHDYWTVYKSHSTLDLATGAAARELLTALGSLNSAVGAS